MPRIVSGALMVLLASCSEAGVGGDAPGSSPSGGGGAPVPAVSVSQPQSSNAAAPTTPAPTTPSADPAFVLGGLDTDQPCTARLTGGRLTRIGVSPEDIPAMSMARELLRAVSKLPEVEGYEWGGSSGFRDNAELADESGSPSRCEALMRVGRVTGYAAEATRECMRGDCPGDPDVPEIVVATVHVMQTDAGAQAFLDWTASTPWGDAGAQPSVHLNDSALEGRPGRVEHMQRGRFDLTRVVDRSAVGEVELVLVRQGAVVGEILVMGPPGAKPAVDALALGVAAAKRIASVSPAPDPYDVMQVMSAPLTMQALDCVRGCQVDSQQPGLSDNQEFLYRMGLQWPECDTHVARYGRRVGYTAGYEVPDLGHVSIGYTLYATPASARAAAAHLNTAQMLGGYPTYFDDDNVPEIIDRFDVPGVDGAVGLAFHVDHQGVALTPSWIVRFPYGRGVAEVMVEGWDSVPEDQIASSDGQRLAIHWADELAARLAKILG